MRAVGFISTGPRAFNILGGEPTLHKDFAKMLEYLIANDFMLQVFTNGMISDSVLESITKVLNRTILRNNQLYFAVNINEPKYRNAEEDRLQKRFLNHMGNLAYPSFTIHDSDVDLKFLVELIDEFYLDRALRIGLAMPIRGASNKFLELKDYRVAAKHIVDLALNTDVEIILDCGFPMCMFTMEELAELNKNKKNDFAFICSCPMDIYPDLTITNCYPLSKIHKIKISEFKNIIDAYTYFENGFYTSEGIYDKCKNCEFFKKICMGGCKGHIKIPEVTTT